MPHSLFWLPSNNDIVLYLAIEPACSMALDLSAAAAYLLARPCWLAALILSIAISRSDEMKSQVFSSEERGMSNVLTSSTGYCNTVVTMGTPPYLFASA